MWDLSAPYSNKVRVRGNEICLADNKNKGYILYSLQPFPETGVYTIKCCLKRSTIVEDRKGIVFGFATKKMKCKNSQVYQLEEMVYYSSWPTGKGKLIIGGLDLWASAFGLNYGLGVSE